MNNNTGPPGGGAAGLRENRPAKDREKAPGVKHTTSRSFLQAHDTDLQLRQLDFLCIATRTLLEINQKLAEIRDHLAVAKAPARPAGERLAPWFRNGRVR
jgi:hypothetical protein